MPELPDITVYVEHLDRRVVGQPVSKVRLANIFLVRTFDPPIEAIVGKTVTGVHRLGKQIVFALEDDLFLVLHLMIAGRLHWKPVGLEVPKKVGLIAIDFPNGSLVLTEAGTKRRASLHLIRGTKLLRQFDRGGLEVMHSSFENFKDALVSENHTVKRSLTDPRLFSGIGNSYSDEILHAAHMSPLTLTQRLSDGAIARLHHATIDTLQHWTDVLRAEAGDNFPERVTAFRDDMAVHGKFGKACPVCGHAVQRIVYAENASNYCPHCQTDGKVLADRALSRLLKDDWPRSIEEMEKLRPVKE